MERQDVVRQLIDVLTHGVTYLVNQGLPDDVYLDTLSIHTARRIWTALKPIMQSDRELKRCFQSFGSTPEDNDKQRALESKLVAIFSKNPALLREIQSLLDDVKVSRALTETPRTFPIPEGSVRTNEALRRLEVLKLLRSGVEAERIAERFEMPVGEVFRINYDYSVGGIRGAMIPENSPSWLEQLDGNDPLLRRLEMVRLLRAGTPGSAVARQFDAVEDYVLFLGQNFAQHGLAGLITDQDVERFQAIHRDTIRICTYNLQGVRNDGPFRFRRIARELAAYRPDLIALQEVISGAGVEDTSGQIARWLSAITGEHYRSHFTYCHQFMDRYPEGVAVCARVAAKTVHSIDLTTHLANGLKPSMARRAQVTETSLMGKRVILASIHLDHLGAGEVRLAQAEKLLSEMDRLTGATDSHAVILAGDLNDTEDSPALKRLKNAGYRDAYRALHRNEGNTFPLPKPNARIDYIMVKGQVEIVAAEVILNNCDFSDHLGLTVVIR